MVDRSIASGVVPFGQHAKAPTTGTNGLFADPDPVLGIPPTVCPPWLLNQLIEEIRNAVIDHGLAPSSQDWTQLSQVITKASSGGRLLRVVVYDTPGSYIYTTGDKATSLRFRFVSGGGAGGGVPGNQSSAAVCAGAPGGGGTYAEGFIPQFSFFPQNFNVLIGAGGIPALGAAGGDGGASSFNGVYCYGGSGGASLRGGGSGSISYGKNFNPSTDPIVGNYGPVPPFVQYGFSSIGTAPSVSICDFRSGGSAPINVAGDGGASHFGGGGSGGILNGLNGMNRGSGGGGTAGLTSGQGLSGGKGADGILIIEEFG